MPNEGGPSTSPSFPLSNSAPPPLPPSPESLQSPWRRRRNPLPFGLSLRAFPSQTTLHQSREAGRKEGRQGDKPADAAAAGD